MGVQLFGCSTSGSTGSFFDDDASESSMRPMPMADSAQHPHRCGRITALGAFLLLLASIALAISFFMPDDTDVSPGFVHRDGSRLVLDGAPYRTIGLNMWQAMYVGAASPARLQRELDALAAAGVTSLRVLGASEGPSSSPLQVVPTLQPSPGVFNETLARGLDLVLHEMGLRGMKAVLVLNNMWSWSGGFAQYLAWARGETWRRIPYPPAPGYWAQRADEGRSAITNASWDDFQMWTSDFFESREAVALASATVHWLATRRNSISRLRYRDDPAILAWELCNEPRAVAAAAARPQRQAAFMQWVSSTAALIKRLAPRQLVTIGSEGWTPYEDYVNVNYTAAHLDPNVDFLTVHVWPQNWDWYDPAGSMRVALERSREYLARHIASARAINKPLLLEEFGLVRDGGRYDLRGSADRRHEFYSALIRQAAAAPEVFGITPWAWGGEGRPRVTGGWWAPRDDVIGDPPHELQGWYSIFDTDTATLQLLSLGFGLARTPAPPASPPAPPPPPDTRPSSPPPPPPPPLCDSGLPESEDVHTATCEDWCAEEAHCAWCKCRACTLCDADPLPSAVSLVAEQGTGAQTACASEMKEDLPYETCETWCSQPENCEFCKCRSCALCARMR